jgi:hypothetical protein
MPKKLLHLNFDGQVLRSDAEYNPSNHVPSEYADTTIIVDSTLPSQQVEITLPDPDGPDSFDPFGVQLSEPVDTGLILTQTVPTVSRTISVNPLTEQILTGSGFGTFTVGEPVFQSTITPIIINNYIVGGVSLDTFVPTIGSIGTSGGIGQRCAQFKGTLLDAASQKAAGIQLPAFTTSASTPHFLLEGWMYLEAEPSNNYDPIIVTRSADGINASSNDSFRLEYDTSSDQVQFHYSAASYASAGYQGIVNVSPSGISTGQWNHFAVAWTNSGNSATVKTYWNGTSLYSASGLSGWIRNSTAPLMVGSGASGDYPLKGWLDDVHIRMGGVTLALADYARLGATAPNVYEQDQAGDYTVYLLSMNGPFGFSKFPVDNLCRVSSSATYYNAEAGVLGVGSIMRDQTSVLGLSLFGGVCGGFTATGGSGGRVFGMASGSCIEVSSVNQLTGISAARQQRLNSMQHTQYFLFGVTVMQGSSGNSGDFVRLFSSGWTGTTYSFLPIQTNVDYLKNLYDNVVVAGYTGTTVIEDYYGVQNYFGTTHVQKLYQDVVSYRSDMNTLVSQVSAQINSSTTHELLYRVQGISATGAVLKLAPYSQENPSLLVSTKAKATKSTNTPENKYLPKGNTPILAGGLGEDE